MSIQTYNKVCADNYRCDRIVLFRVESLYRVDGSTDSRTIFICFPHMFYYYSIFKKTIANRTIRTFDRAYPSTKA